MRTPSGSVFPRTSGVRVAIRVQRWLAAIFVCAAVAEAAYLGGASEFWPQLTPAPAQRAPAPAIPVVASTVKRIDVPIYINGLGTVQAFNSVVVKSRVDGQIVKIHFAEGKDI